MLLDFKVKNYKTFLDETTFTMNPDSSQESLSYSILSDEIEHKTTKALSSSVIYGANASGKTNIIGAMEVLRSIVLNGNICNSELVGSPNIARSKLELIPNNMAKGESVSFAISFTTDGMKVDFSLDLDLGTFLQSNYSRKILSEKLCINDVMIYHRNDKLFFGEGNEVERYISKKFASGDVFEIAQNSLNDEELFLTNGFKLIINKELATQVVRWFDEKFKIMYHSNLAYYKRNTNGLEKETVYIDSVLNKAVKDFGLSSTKIGLIVNESGDDTILCSVVENCEDKRSMLLPIEDFESYGTVRFIHLFPSITYAMTTGSTLVIDEFDASIHPMSLMSIINIFHNDELNKNNAQLIFNTHNPIFLNSNLFRQDEIKFVERDEKTLISSIYSLSDFKGENTVYPSDDYMNNYLISRYGAIKDVDFSTYFENLEEEKSDATNE